ncbi:hemolysin III family protein [bacterium]|nr:hemolysin III family protein [bacterium]
MEQNNSVSVDRIEDEIANAATHGIGLMFAMGGLCSMIVLMAFRGGSFWHIAGCTVYGISLVVLYAASTLYHSTKHPARKEMFRKLDHAAIYGLIAGTYTPFTLVNLHGPISWILFAGVWVLAIAGIVVKILWGDRWQWLSLTAFIGLGWMGVLAAKPIFETFPIGLIALLLAGGIAYTLGTIFFALDHVPYFHAVWHLFVMLGSILHFLAVLQYVIPKDI